MTWKLEILRGWAEYLSRPDKFLLFGVVDFSPAPPNRRPKVPEIDVHRFSKLFSRADLPYPLHRFAGIKFVGEIAIFT
jgi:hypothetical protein